MLNIYYGDYLNAVYDTSMYFRNAYKGAWIVDPFVKEMIHDVDRSEVIDQELIKSPYLGMIDPTKLSGGVKTLILILKDDKHVFNASNCGDNCAGWLLKIADKKEP